MKFSYLFYRIIRVPKRIAKEMAKISPSLKGIYYKLFSKRKNIKGNIILLPPHPGDISEGEIEKFISNLDYEECMWDIGAHVGSVSIRLQYKFNKILAFEPHPENFSFLQESISLNKINNIKAVSYAVGNVDGDITMNVQPLAGSQIGSLAEDSRLTDKIIVECKKIDSLVKEFPTPDIVKIDVEGAEYKVIHGAKDTLENKNIDWIIEVHVPETQSRIDRMSQHGDDYIKLHSLLSEKKYKIYGIRDGKLIEFDIRDGVIPLFWYATKAY